MADEFARKRHGAEARREMNMYAPERLVIVTEKDDPLYDERVLLPVSEELVASIITVGVQVPIIVVRDGQDKEGIPIVKVVDGRQRVRACLEVNRRLAKVGKEPLRVPGVPFRGTETEQMGLNVLTNELRTQDGPIVRAKKMGRLQQNGVDVAGIARVFGRSAQSVREHLSLLDCAEEVQKAVEALEIPVGVAKSLSPMPRAEQVATLAKMREEGKLVGKEAKVAAAEAVGPKRGRTRASPTHKVKPFAEVDGKRKELLKKLNSKHPNPTLDGFIAGLAWVLGEEKALEEIKP